MRRGELKAVYVLLTLALMVSGGMATYALLNPPQRERYVIISALNSDQIGVGLIYAQNGSEYYFYCLVENRLGYTGYFRIEVLRGLILNDTNPSFSECSPWGNRTVILRDSAETLLRINDTVNITSSFEKYIYYFRLYSYSFDTHVLQYTGQWVAMQVNVTAM